MNISSPQESYPLVLIIDDDKFMRMQLHCMLEAEGYQIIEATDGEEGLAACAQYAPDIILLDAMMPVMDGFTCCHQLRRLPESARIPVLMITSLEDQESVDQAFEVGASDYITKPVHWGVLRQRVLRMIQASRAEEEIRKALEKEKELNELKSRFVSMTSHEFRNPLSTILFAAELLQHHSYKLTDEKKQKYLCRIQSAVKQMNHLLNEVLEIGKAEAGKLEFNPIPIDLSTYCQYIVEEIQLTAGSNYLLVFNNIGTCSQACMDEQLLRSILINLLSNAVKYSPDGGKIHLELVCQPESVTFRIQDEGIGISAVDQAKLFNTFHRGNNVGKIAGTGLGLAIVKNCVELHGGTIVVESEVGAGTTFLVTLPLHHQLYSNSPIS
jgi:signal transduction histidine kinase